MSRRLVDARWIRERMDAKDERYMRPQPDLFERVPLSDGPGLEPADHQRLATHLERVRVLMSSGAWMTLDYIAESVGCSQAGASARLRDLRKLKHGAHTVSRKRANRRRLALPIGVVKPGPAEMRRWPLER